MKITSTYYNPTTGAQIPSDVAYGGKAVVSSKEGACWLVRPAALARLCSQMLLHTQATTALSPRRLLCACHLFR
jgi:hypothetical protein